MDRRRRLDRLVQDLNEDLARLLGSIIRNNYQAAKAAGPYAEQLRQLFRREAAEELDRAATLAEVIVKLGGEPTTTPAEFDKPCTSRLMLELDVMLEEDEVRRYTEQARVAHELAEEEVHGRLGAMAAAHALHATELARVLASMRSPPAAAPN